MFCYDFPPNHPEFPNNGWLYPMIVPPSRVKYYDDLPDLLPVLWQKAADRMRRADEVVIIGYSFPATDQMSWDLLDEATRWGRIRVTLVDPYPESVAQRLTSRLGKRITLEIKPVGFAAYAKSLTRPARVAKVRRRSVQKPSTDRRPKGPARRNPGRRRKKRK
jgi:hypothetical protein